MGFKSGTGKCKRVTSDTAAKIKCLHRFPLLELFDLSVR